MKIPMINNVPLRNFSSNWKLANKQVRTLAVQVEAEVVLRLIIKYHAMKMYGRVEVWFYLSTFKQTNSMVFSPQANYTN
jgi:hypothetical protein